MKTNKIKRVCSIFLFVCFGVTASLAYPVVAVPQDLTTASSEFKEDVWGEYFDMVEAEIEGMRYLPEYSPQTIERITALYNDVCNTDYQSFEQLLSDRERLQTYFRTKCVSAAELGDILTIFDAENNDGGYYDEQTWSEFIAVYEEAKASYADGDEEAIHIAYIKSANMLNQLCLYNTTFGDINHDGKFNIKDVTEIQRSLAEFRPNLNISQICVVYDFVEKDQAKRNDFSSPTIYPSIGLASDMQSFLAEITTGTPRFDNAISAIRQCGGAGQYELYPENRTISAREFQANTIYQMYLEQVYNFSIRY